MFTRNLSKIIIVTIFTGFLLWFGMSLKNSAENLMQVQQSRMDKIDSIFDRN